jgi:hypothetical protein
MTDTELCNNALRLIGHSPILDIDSTEDDTAVTCKQLLTSCRLFMLRDNNWNRAIKRAPLTQDPTAPEWGFYYKYAIPSDCLKIIETGDNAYEFQAEGGFILTDNPTLEIRYVQDLPIANFDPMMTTALETLLASRLSSALLHDDRKSLDKYELYRVIVSDAKATDGMEGSPRDAWGATGYGSIRQFRVS